MIPALRIETPFVFATGRLALRVALAHDTRQQVDEDNLRSLNLVVNAVKGDPEEGVDGGSSPRFSPRSCVAEREGHERGISLGGRIQSRALQRWQNVGAWPGCSRLSRP